MSTVKGYDVYLNDHYLGFVRGRNRLSREFIKGMVKTYGFGRINAIWKPLEDEKGLYVLDDAAQELKLVEVSRLRETLRQYIINI